MPLKSRNKMPPGGWQYFQPETGWEHPCPLSDTFDKSVQRIIKMRKNNPRFKFALSQKEVEEHLETYTCHRLHHDPAWCTPDQKKTNLQESKELSQSEPRFPSPVPARPARLRNYLNGSKILVDWLGAGGKPVSKFEAQSRANICIECPLNVKGGFMDSISGSIAGFLKAKSDLKLSVAMEEKLHTCDACSCHLPLKVWTPLNYILENMDAGTMAKLHPSCWVKKKTTKRPVGILQLGRAGDVINILPIAKELSERRGFPIPIVIHEDYADLLEGVSYAEPEIYHGEISDFNGALEFAKERFSEVIETQIYGKTTFEMKHDSFCVDSWELGNFGSLWGKLPLVFDRRDKGREQVLIEKHVKTTKPLLLVNFKGISSPFQYSGPVMADITQRWGNLFEILNLAGVQAERFFDLLGLMEKAAGIISIDTGTAHLAGATKTPMVMLQASTPHLWNGTKPPKNCELVLRYPESLRRREEMHCVIDSWLPNRKKSRFWHVYSDFASPGDHRRASVAALTWAKVYDEQWRSIPVRDEQLPRLFHDKGRELPFVKDLIDFASVFAFEEDYIVFTNRDICFARSITEQLQKMIQVSEVGCGHRRNFDKPFNEPIDDANVRLGVVYLGTDIFIFSRKWWLANRSMMPDMLLGAEAWDAALHHVMEITVPHCVRIHDQIYHEKHEAIWMNSENRRSLPSQIHNQKLAVEFFESRNIDPARFGMLTRKPIKSVRSEIANQIVQFYRGLEVVPKKEMEPWGENSILTNASKGLGDTLILTSIIEAARKHGVQRRIFSDSKHFEELARRIEIPIDSFGELVIADAIQHTVNMGNGHFTQRLCRAAGLVPPIKPSCFVPSDIKKKPIVALHFDPGIAAIHQREIIHPRARMLYPESKLEIETFISSQRYRFEFVEIGMRPAGIIGSETRPNSTLSETIDFLASCEYFIGIMSGPIHLATALGVKCIGIVNFPSANQIVLPTLKDAGILEAEWMYPQNVHLHQEGSSLLVPRLSVDTLRRAFDGNVYPFWSDEWLSLILEKI